MQIVYEQLVVYLMSDFQFRNLIFELELSCSIYQPI